MRLNLFYDNSKLIKFLIKFKYKRMIYFILRVFFKETYLMWVLKVNSHFQFRQLWTCVWLVTHTSTGARVSTKCVRNTSTWLSTNRGGREKRSTNLAVRTSSFNLDYPSSLSTFSFWWPPASSSICAGRRGWTKLRSFGGGTFTKLSSNYFSNVSLIFNPFVIFNLYLTISLLTKFYELN